MARFQIEHVQAKAGEGATCYFLQTKDHRTYLGMILRAPALAKRCQVDTHIDWISAAALEAVPMFRAIDRCEHVNNHGLNIDSQKQILRTPLIEAGLASAGRYRRQSLMRGFSNWATANGECMKSLMEYTWRKYVLSTSIAQLLLRLCPPYPRTATVGAARTSQDQ